MVIAATFALYPTTGLDYIWQTYSGYSWIRWLGFPGFNTEFVFSIAALVSLIYSIYFVAYGYIKSNKKILIAWLPVTLFVAGIFLSAALIASRPYEHAFGTSNPVKFSCRELWSDKIVGNIAYPKKFGVLADYDICISANMATLVSSVITTEDFDGPSSQNKGDLIGYYLTLVFLYSGLALLVTRGFTSLIQSKSAKKI